MGRRRSVGTGATRGTRSSTSLSLPGVAVLLALGLAACQDTAPTTAPLGAARAPSLAAAPDASASDVLPDEYIVTFRNDVPDAPGLAKQLAAQHGATVRFTYTAALNGFAAHMSAQAAAALQSNPQVARIEADRVVTANGLETQAPWGLDRIDQQALPFDSVYSYARTGAGVNVYIIDTGIRGTHVDFGGRVVGAYSSVPDGYGTNDCHGHGTHVAGTVGGARYGVAKGVRLYAVRVLDCGGSGSISGIVAGVDWVTRNHVAPAVANMSIGTATSSTLDQAVESSVASGVVYTVSAGNNATDACSQSPARATSALTIAATQSDDAQATFSNYGPCVDLYAPGRLVLSLGNATDTSTALKSGTSMAAPHVAGAAALYLEGNPGASPSVVAQALTSSAIKGAVTAIGSGSPNLLLYVGDLDVAVPAPAPAPLPTTPLKAGYSSSCARSLCTFDASGTSGGATPYTYGWSFGDASPNTSMSSAKASHQYTAKGSYVVTLTVTDANGQRASTSTTVSIKRM